MKKSNILFNKTSYYKLFILGFIFLFSGCQDPPVEEIPITPEVVEVPKFDNIIWNVKAIHPDGQTLDIKAFDKKGNSFDIKAIQNSDQDSFLDVKAIREGKEIPVKMLVSEEEYIPVKAIDNDGSLYDIKAITAEGVKIDVKGIVRVGYIVIMKAITEKNAMYAIKAISPTGQMNDVKGIKINQKEREMSLKGNDVHAHVKAMHPAPNEDKFKKPRKKKSNAKNKNDFKRIIWNVKAVTPEGKNLNIKAFDAAGNQYDVKATQDSKQHSFMSIKALVKGFEIPIKIIESDNEYAPIKAIGEGGDIFDIKAIGEGDVKLDVKGISRSGNIIHVKAINENGEFYGVKAFSPDGKLNDVKGIKIFERRLELKMRGVPVYAHFKAITQ